jgi:hypothetical protein
MCQGSKESRSDLTLPLFLDNHGKDLVDGRQGIHEQDLASDMRKGLIESHQKLENILTMLIIQDSS